MTDLTEKDCQLITEVRDEVKGLLSAKYDTDYNIFRWIKASGHNKDEAVKRLKQHLITRKLYDLDHIMETLEDDELSKKYIPLGLLGPTGKDNNLVIIECAGRSDPTGLLQVAQNYKFLKQRFKFMEKLYQAMNEQERLNKTQSAAIYVLDLEGLVFDSSLISTITGPYRILWDRIGDNYPEWINRFLIVNVPTFMSVIWKAFYPLIPTQTSEKIIITGENWKEQILEYISPENIPVHWGGTMVDENGDEMCRSKLVIPTEKIPPEIYWKPLPGEPGISDLTPVTVTAGTIQLVSKYVLDPGTIMTWYIQGDQEYTFAIYFSEDPKVNDIQEMEEIMPNSECPGLPTIGSFSITCEKSGAYHMKFGNEKAWFYSVIVNYQLKFTDSKGENVDVIAMENME